MPDANNLEVGKTYRLSVGSVIMKKIKLTPELKNSGNVFVKLQCRSDGDAYDRTGSVFIVPVLRLFLGKASVLVCLQGTLLP